MFSFFRNLRNSLSNDIAIDLGTANTLVYVKGKGIILNEPSVVAVSYEANRYRVLSVGNAAKRMIGRTPANTKAISPLRDGVIADFDMTEAMIKYFISSCCTKRSFLGIKPNAIVCVPSGATQIERKAIKEATEASGIGQVFLIQEPMAAAIGAGMPVNSPIGSMIVDVGGGTTEIAIISLGGIVHAESLRVGGDKMNEAIISYVRRNNSLLIGEATAEYVKHNVGNVLKPEKGEGKNISIKGRDIINGIPREVVISEAQIAEALIDTVLLIVNSVRCVLENADPELSSDIVDRGIIMAGGGALLPGLAEAISQATNLKIKVAKDPQTCVVIGTGACLDVNSALRNVLE